jgi:hypothetical protein
MTVAETCPECKVPRLITGEHLWLNSGVMVQKANQAARLAFMECENLDPLYSGIGEIIGMPVDRMVIDIARRATSHYLEGLLPQAVKEMILDKEMDIRVYIDALLTTARIFGSGKYEFVDVRFKGDKDDYGIIRITEPYSLLLSVGVHAGSCEALTDNPNDVTYKELSPGVYESKAYWSDRSEELEERLYFKQYHHREGDIELERCATCGGPKALSGFKWYLDRGIITNTSTNRRMALLGPAMLDPIFRELEKELGETIPRVVVEAQRRFVKTGFYSIEEVSDSGDFRTQLALRGLGNLREMKMGTKGLSMRIDNAALHLMIVGLAQGLFEMAFDVDSHVEWELSEDEDLELEVTPQLITEMISAG